ncbi:MAG: hypothetical protein GY704_03495, partial [Phycisphaeraceae bacterium]|nr:hypothetical protein [Phycisphaeraceae bacterium]
ATQSTVEDKVTAVGDLLMSPLFAAAYPDVATRHKTAVGEFRDWRKARIRTGSGFALDAFGMDQAMRGAKVGSERPDWLILDDFEEYADTVNKTKKRRDEITRTILPAGSDDAAVLVIQNRIRSDSIMSTLLDGTADFLNDRIVSGPWPQIEGLEVDTVDELDDDGATRPRHRIVAGRPTWPEGLGIGVSEREMNDEGLVAWRAEKQHETDIEEGDLFPRDMWRTAEAGPDGLRFVRAWDLASTEGGGDHTVGVLMGRNDKTGDIWVLDVIRGQWGTAKVEDTVAAAADADADRYGKHKVETVIEKPTGSDGEHWRTRVLPGHKVKLVKATGSKEDRATAYSADQQRAKVHLVDAGDWHGPWIREHAQFPDFGRYDDIVDAAAHAYNRLAETARSQRKFRISATAAGRTMPAYDPFL